MFMSIFKLDCIHQNINVVESYSGESNDDPCSCGCPGAYGGYA